MSEARKTRSSRPFVALALASVVALFQGGAPAVAGDDHDQARDLRHAGDIVPLSALLARPKQAACMSVTMTP